MKKYVFEYMKRGLIFSGFGPVICGIVFLFISLTVRDFAIGGAEILVAIVSTYILAFVQAGASVFNQIEHWSIGKSLVFHLGSIYFAYLFTYLVNSWIPFEPVVVLIFTLAFLATYFAVWLTVFCITRSLSKKINSKLP